MSFYGLSLPTGALTSRTTSSRGANQTKSSTVHQSHDLPHRRGSLASVFTLWEKRANRRGGTSSEISEYISLYTVPSRDEVVPTLQHLENIKPAPLNNGSSIAAGIIPHFSEQQEIASPSSDLQVTPRVIQKIFSLPVPDLGSSQLDVTPGPSEAAALASPSGSSNYPSEGIRSEECLSPPDTANANFCRADFTLSELVQYCPSSITRERTSEMRSTSLTDHDGPHGRNESASLQEELAAADDEVSAGGSTVEGDADRSSGASSSRSSSGTIIGRRSTVDTEDLVLRKKVALAEGWGCMMTADGEPVQCTFMNRANTAERSSRVEEVDSSAGRLSHKKLKIKKWVKKTWSKTKGRLAMKDAKALHGKHHVVAV